MNKIENCPNNTFDCGVMCGLGIGFQSAVKIIEKFKDKNKQIEILSSFITEMHQNLSSKHLEHLDDKYKWKTLLNKYL